MPRAGLRAQTGAGDSRQTVGATAVCLGAVALIATALITSSGDPESSASPGRRAAASTGLAPAQVADRPERVLHVRQQNCDDAETVDRASDPATPWCSPARAIEAAPPGATVVVEAGRYPALTVNGRTGRLDLTFQAAPGTRPELAGLALQGSHGLRVKGFRVTGATTIQDAEDLQLTGNNFAGRGLVLRRSRRVEIEGNTIHDLEGEERGILAQGSYGPRGVDNEDMLLRRNRFSRMQHDPIAFYNGYRRVTVEGNHIDNALQPPGFRFHTDAMQFMAGDRLTLRNNVVSRVSQGILVKDGGATTHLVVEGNLVHDVVGGPGLQLFNAPGARLAHNTIWATRFGAFLRNDAGVNGRTSAWLFNNVFDRLTVEDRSAVSRASSNVFGGGSTTGRPAYRGRPNFRDPARGDYRLDPKRPGAGIRRAATFPGTQIAG